MTFVLCIVGSIYCDKCIVQFAHVVIVRFINQGGEIETCPYVCFYMDGQDRQDKT